MPAPVKQKINAANAATLSTPCTLQALRNWLTGIDQMGSGAEKDVTVASTASTITVS